MRLKRGNRVPVGVLTVVLAALFILAGVTGCDQAPSSDETISSSIEVTDQLGRVVKLEGVPQRIISLAPSNTEILFALGLADRVVGVTDYCDYPPEAQDKPSIGGFSTPNMEEVLALSPDLVLAADIHKDEIRAICKFFNLDVQSKPSMACFSSRIPYGQIINEEKLAMIREAEKFLRDRFNLKKQRGFNNVKTHKGLGKI